MNTHYEFELDKENEIIMAEYRMFAAESSKSWRSCTLEDATVCKTTNLKNNEL